MSKVTPDQVKRLKLWYHRGIAHGLKVEEVDAVLDAALESSRSEIAENKGFTTSEAKSAVPVVNAAESIRSAASLGAYRWIDGAVPLLKQLREVLVKAHTGMRSDDTLDPGCSSCAEIIAIDHLLMGVPTPNVDLGFDSPADRAARAQSSASRPDDYARCLLARMPPYLRVLMSTAKTLDHKGTQATLNEIKRYLAETVESSPSSASLPEADGVDRTEAALDHNAPYLRAALPACYHSFFDKVLMVLARRGLAQSASGENK